MPGGDSLRSEVWRVAEASDFPKIGFATSINSAWRIGEGPEAWQTFVERAWEDVLKRAIARLVADRPWLSRRSNGSNTRGSKRSQTRASSAANRRRPGSGSSGSEDMFTRTGQSAETPTSEDNRPYWAE